jgi:hypothetical protein
MSALSFSASLMLVLGLGSRLAIGAAPLATRPAARPTTQQVQSIVDLLASDDWKVRQKAMEDLTALGPLAEGDLRARLKKNPDPGMASAIEALLGQIAEAGKISPTLITLQLKSASAKDAAAAIAREGHMAFVAGAESLLADLPQPIDVNFDRTPMWQAVQELCAKTSMAFSEVDHSGQIVLIPANGNVPPPPLAMAGPFLLAIGKIEITSSHVQAFGSRRTLNGRSSSDAVPGCRIFLFPYCEPRLNAIHWFVDSIDESVTDKGKIETEKNDWRGRGGGHMGSWSNEVQLSLKVPPEATKIVSLKMMARFVLQEETQKLEVPDILTVKNSTHLLAGFPLVIKGVHKVGENRYAYELEISRDGHSEAEWSLYQSLIDTHSCRLVDADGEALGGVGGGGGGVADKITWNYTLTRDKGNGKQTGEPVKLVWEVPSRTRQVIVPMEFRDIELPK